MASAAEEKGQPSGTLERGLSTLEFLARARESSAAEVVGALGLSRSAAYRILDTLRDRGYLELSPASGKYRLGTKAAELGMAALLGVDAVRLAPPYLRELARETEETVFLGVMDEGAVVYVYKEDGPGAVTMSSNLGSRRPLHCTALVKAILSALPDEERRTLVAGLDLRRFTPNTITDGAALEEEIGRTRERGYAIDNVEVEEGVACFAAPVLDHRNVPVAAVSAAGPAGRILLKGERVGPLVRGTASALSRRLGHVDTSVEGGS